MPGILPIYTTRAACEEVGVPVSGWTAARFNRLNLTIGNFVDRITRQRFICYGETVKMSGEDRVIIERPDRLPIISISSIEVDPLYTTRVGKVFSGTLADVAIPRPDLVDGTSWVFGSTYSFESGTYALKPDFLPRYIESVRGLFPGGSNNISVTGVFGWPELSSVKTTPFSTTTTTNLTPTSTTLGLTSTVGLKPRDVMIVDGYPIIAQGISGGTVTIDAPTGIISDTIATGATVVSYAAVPYDIERVVHFLMVREIARQSSWASGNFQDPSMIMQEKTDKYEYKMFAPAQTISFGKAPGLTAVAEIDELLTSYTAPPSVEFA